MNKLRNLGIILTNILKFSNNVANIAFDEVRAINRILQNTKNDAILHTIPHIKTTHHTSKPHIISQNHSSYTTHQLPIQYTKVTYCTSEPPTIHRNHISYVETTHHIPHINTPYHTPKPHTVYQNHSPYHIETRHKLKWPWK